MQRLQTSRPNGWNCLRIGIAAFAACAAWGIAGAAGADRVVVKGVALEGTVESISRREVVMTTVYGSGTLTIPLEDVDSLETDTAFHVVHGDDLRTVGPVTGITPEALRVAEPSGAVEVPLGEIYIALRDPGPDANVLERMDIELPYWNGNFDLAFSATQATDDTLSFATALGITRSRGPHRTALRVHYKLGTEQTKGQEEDTTVNEIYGKIRHEYDFADRWFAFGKVDGEYDEIESLSFRTVPTLGVGYEVYRSEKAWFNVDTGFTWVYERFFGGDKNDYPGVTFGAESDWKLPFGGAVWHNRVDYTPSFEDWIGDYLIRAETSFVMPLWAALSFKVSVMDAYDSTPSQGNDENSLSTLVGVSYGF